MPQTCAALYPPPALRGCASSRLTFPQFVDLAVTGVTVTQARHVCLLNYRKDGTAFYNQFFIAPLRRPLPSPRSLGANRAGDWSGAGGCEAVGAPSARVQPSWQPAASSAGSAGPGPFTDVPISTDSANAAGGDGTDGSAQGGISSPSHFDGPIENFIGVQVSEVSPRPLRWSDAGQWAFA